MTDLEREVSRTLREGALEVVEERGLDDQKLADALELFPDGARRLRHEKEWPVAVALRVLGALGVPVHVEVGKTP